VEAITTVDAAALAWPDALAHVLAEPGLVTPVFQPIVDLERGAAAGFEALARFHSAPKAPPPFWIEAAYRLGRGAELEALLLERGLAARADVPPSAFLAVNLSPRALMSREVEIVLARAESLAGVVVEVTEQAEVEDYARLQQVIARIRAAGGRLAIDDAGAGYASLSHILALRPEFVKLDRGLVSGIDRDEAKRGVVESLAMFTGRIGAQLVAEGVETEAEMAALQRIGTPFAQGYALGRPVAAMAEIEPELAARVRAARPPRPDSPLVEPIVEQVEAVVRRDTSELTSQGPRHVPIVDFHNRPVALLVRDSASERMPLCIEPSDTLADAARRALTRPPAERFDPLVCCDSAGEYLGLVKVERLVESLAALADAR
jgi:EAL domain-containing protein (putative c-di-GMP-specific phosphodiesterase class I)